MNRWIILFAFCALACQREQPAPVQTTTAAAATTTTLTGEPQDMTNKQVTTELLVPPQREYVSDSRVGTAVDKDGFVSADLETFKRTQPVRVTMWFKESPSGLQASSQVFDENDQKVAEDRKDMKGAKTVTFTFDAKKWKPGMYRIVGYWGGNVATEHVVKVTR